MPKQKPGGERELGGMLMHREERVLPAQGAAGTGPQSARAALPRSDLL